MTVLVSTRVKIALAVWAMVITLLTGCLSVLLEKRYLDQHPYFFDAVSYSLYNAKLHQLVEEIGQVTVIRGELLNNNRNPLRTVPLVMFAPSLLAHPFGHMATSLPSLFAFVFLLGYSLYRRVGRLAPAISGSSIAALLPGLYNPISGIAAYWLDLTAALLMGAAILALLNSNHGRQLRWLLVFVLLGSCAAFARYVSIAYLLFASGPVFAWHLFSRVRKEGNWPRSVLLPALVTTVTGVLVAGPYLFAHVGSVSEFYRTYGYALGTPVATSIKAVLTSLRAFIGPAGILAIFVLTGAWLLQVVRARNFDTEGLLVPVWLVLAIPIFQIFVLKTWAPHTISYAAIPLLVALALLWARFVKKDGALFKRAGLIVMLIICAGWGGYYTTEWKLSSHPSPEAAEAKVLQTQLADILAQYGRKTVWNAYFDEVSWIPSLDAFYRHGILPLPLNQDYVFSIHESVYKGNYPGWGSAQINEALYKNANTWLNIAVVFDEPSEAEKYLPNELSRNAARYLADAIKNNPAWRKDHEIETHRYGRLAVYRNLHALPDSYKVVLQGRANLQPVTKTQ
jgi:hypothetical protein